MTLEILIYLVWPPQRNISNNEVKMDQTMKRKLCFLLRLPTSVRDEATQIAQEDGTSLNHFISLAVAEEITRMNQHAMDHPAKGRPPERLSRLQ